jgi:hypothetical protein
MVLRATTHSATFSSDIRFGMYVQWMLLICTSHWIQTSSVAYSPRANYADRATVVLVVVVVVVVMVVVEQQNNTF